MLLIRILDLAYYYHIKRRWVIFWVACKINRIKKEFAGRSYLDMLQDDMNNVSFSCFNQMELWSGDIPTACKCDH